MNPLAAMLLLAASVPTGPIVEPGYRQFSGALGAPTLKPDTRKVSPRFRGDGLDAQRIADAQAKRERRAAKRRGGV